ncbi:MAG: methyltransferase domain-containing protein [Candidatus Bathyarchaeota archaeon]|nr:methyltransferase domain-containing protein [Candidatus Bathyarchaeota archaeon]
MEELPEGLAASGATRILGKLRLIDGGKVLDVGTSDGDFIITLMKSLKGYGSFVGIDNSAKEVKAAKKRFKEQSIEILKMDAEALRFEDNSFDTVCVSYSLHHLSHIDKVMAEMKRVLKPGGHFIVQEMFSDGTQTEAQRTEILQHHWDAEIDRLFGISHSKTLTKQKILGIIDDLNLRTLTVIESTHPVKCLFCEEKFECDNPKSEKIMSQALKEVDEALGRLEKCYKSKARVLQEEGDKIKEKLRRYGSASASIIFFMGKK